MTASTPDLPEPVDILAFGPHPDDVELNCSGTLAAAAARTAPRVWFDMNSSTRCTPEPSGRRVTTCSIFRHDTRQTHSDSRTNCARMSNRSADGIEPL